MNQRIGIVGNPDELCATYVAWVARKRDCEVIMLPENELGVGWSYAFDDQCPENGELTVGDRRLPFSAFDGLFVRLFHQPRLPAIITDVAPDREALFIVERRASLQHFLASFPRVVINPPSAGRSNGSKPFQMRTLAEAGFRVPRWIASNDRAAVTAFLEGLPQGAIYKACSGLRSRVRRVDDAFLDRLAASTPLVVQEYIAGRDVRVHTVLDAATTGDPDGSVFPTEVCSTNGIDYRWDPGEHEFAPCEIPAGIARLCFRVAASEGLVLAGFDFRVGDDGVWHCLEVNPVPTFITYQAATRQEIGETIVARMLQDTPRTTFSPAMTGAFTTYFPGATRWSSAMSSRN
jgi:glutathione synthase/RimK-type ligase-like ATP-grasp enzyme